MKKNLLSLLSFAVLIFAVSCSDDDDQYNNTWISLTTVDSLSTSSYTFVKDDGKVLTPIENGSTYRPKNKQRVFVRYTVLDETSKTANVKVYGVETILTKKTIFLTPATADSIGHDPVKIFDMWPARGFMNISFGYNYGGQKRHMINLVENVVQPRVVGDTVYLEFRHNAFKDPQQQAVRGFACFDISPYKIEGKDKTHFVVTVNEFNNGTPKEKVYQITYDYSKEVDKNITFDNSTQTWD